MEGVDVLEAAEWQDENEEEEADNKRTGCPPAKGGGPEGTRIKSNHWSLVTNEHKF